MFFRLWHFQPKKNERIEEFGRKKIRYVRPDDFLLKNVLKQFFSLAFFPTGYGLGFLNVFCQLIELKNNLAHGANP